VGDQGEPVPRISRVSYPVTALGPGTRLGVWFQGCPLACAGCISRDTWSPSGGGEMPVDELVDRWRRALEEGADGLTVSGGEPLEQPEALEELLRRAGQVRTELNAEADILAYTGYEPAEISAGAPIWLADATITGRYDVTRETGLIWRGSANQTLTPHTDLGRRRYARYLDHVPPRAPMQASADERGIWFIGVPRRGDMARLQRELTARGVSSGGVTWRP
jgi:anaerobic ribonucleoside-triphosphate reductase activating protein